MNNKQLLIRGIIKMFSGIIALGLLLFLPAGTFAYPGAWRMILIMFVPMLFLGGFLFLKAPKLLEKRLSNNEGESEQKMVILASALMFTASFILCGLDQRFGWTHIPLWLSVIGCIIFLLTYAGFGELLRENAYLSRTVEVQQDQQVVSTGLYGIVRHPMYFIITFMFLSMPIIIGSFVGLIPLLVLPAILVKRIRNEEEVLKEGLPGYEEYMKKVRYHMIPFLW